jgi:hypothetical protein
MSTSKIDNMQFLITLFRDKIILVIDEISQILNCTNRTAIRYLDELKVHTSYNKNGKYKVLPDVPQFNQNGLWNYHDIFFSKYGTLKQTVISLINDSEKGFTSFEIENIVKISSRTFLSNLQKKINLNREKINGRFVYFSTDKNVYENQKQKRLECDLNSKIINFPSSEEAIIILVEKIKKPELDINEISEILNKKGYLIFPNTIRKFFEHHSILKKN